MLRAVHDHALAFYRQQLTSAPDDSPAVAAVRARRLPDDILEAARVGYAPVAWTAVTDHLRSLRFRDEQLVDAGVGLQTSRGTVVDRFRDRIMFPIPDGQLRRGTLGFLGRSLDPHAGQEGAPPKYLNSPDTAIYHKGSHLYGLDLLAAMPDAVPVVVEGPWDALAVTAAGDGRYVGIATGGTALTAGHVAQLDTAVTLAERGVVTAFDEDAAGHQAGLHAYPLLRAVDAWPTSAPGLPGHDPSKLYADYGHDVLLQSLDAAATRPLADQVLDTRLARWADRLDSAEGQVFAARAAATLILEMPDQHQARQMYRATMHGIAHHTLLDAIDEALAERTPARPPTHAPAAAAAGPTAPLPTASGPVALAASTFPLALTSITTTPRDVTPPPATAATTLQHRGHLHR